MALSITSKILLDVEVSMNLGRGLVSPVFVLRGLTQNEALAVLEDEVEYASARIVARRAA